MIFTDKDIFTFVRQKVDEAFMAGENIDHDTISSNFLSQLESTVTNETFERILICSGFIPDLYTPDSSEETLFSKLTEALICDWARRLNLPATMIKQKASYEDVKININDKTIVCDAKSFRLGRSQQAPNAKDFLKLEDIRKWMERYDNSLGGLVVYPCKHEWTSHSDIYQYCSTKDVPTLMLPYKYLALLLHFSIRFSSVDLLKLWDYNVIFPEKLLKDMAGGNKEKYWEKINWAISNFLNISRDEIDGYIKQCNIHINNYVAFNIGLLESCKASYRASALKEIEGINGIEELKKKLVDLISYPKVKCVDILIDRIKRFRQ